MLISKESIKIGYYANQGLEYEDTVKENVLLGIVETKTKEVLRKENIKCYMSMSNISKKALDIKSGKVTKEA